MENINVEGFMDCPKLALRLVSAGVDISKIKLLQPIHDERLLHIWYAGECIQIVGSSQSFGVCATQGNEFSIKNKDTNETVFKVSEGRHLPHDKIKGLSTDKDILLVLMGKHPDYYHEMIATNLWQGILHDHITVESVEQLVSGPSVESFEGILVEGYFLNEFDQD